MFNSQARASRVNRKRGRFSRQGGGGGGGYTLSDFTFSGGLTGVSVVKGTGGWTVTATDGVTLRGQFFTDAQMAAIEAGTQVGYIYLNAANSSGTFTATIWYFAAVAVEFEYQGYVGVTQDPAWNTASFVASGETDWTFKPIGFNIQPSIGTAFAIVGQAQVFAAISGASGADLVETNVNIGGVLYNLYHYRTPGTFNPNFTGGYLDYELVGGGGEGARQQYGGAGGGAGGQVLQGNTVVPAGTGTAIVVATPQTPLALAYTAGDGRKGSNSSLGSITTIATGGGQSRTGGGATKDGASGGGAYDTTTRRGLASSSGVTGYNGGIGILNEGGGGGGGMGGVGGDASGQNGGNGGAPVVSMFTGTARSLSAGGGGSASSVGGTGGTSTGGGAGSFGGNGGDGTSPGSGGGGTEINAATTRPGVGARGEVVLRLKV